MHDYGSKSYATPSALNIRAGEAPEPGEISLLSVVNVVLRRRWFAITIAAMTTALIVAVGLVRPRTYSATASFMPQSRKVSTALSGLASQFGVSIPTADGGESPQFYVDLLHSRDILRATVNTRYDFTTDTGRVITTLVEYYRPDEETAALKLEAAMKRLRDDVKTAISQRTGVITLTVTTPQASLSQQVAARMLQLVNQFNLERRQSQAAEERRFADQRVAEVKGDLRTTEDRLQSFLQSNREYDNSPALRFEQERLNAEVSLQRQLFSTLTQAREQAKIDEVRDTPVITIVESPEAPVRPDRRGLLFKGILGVVAGTILGILLALAREYFARSGAEDSKEYKEFTTLRRHAVADLTHPWRPITRLLARKGVGS